MGYQISEPRSDESNKPQKPLVTVYAATDTNCPLALQHWNWTPLSAVSSVAQQSLFGTGGQGETLHFECNPQTSLRTCARQMNVPFGHIV
jgi:hypothetical protein